MIQKILKVDVCAFVCARVCIWYRGRGPTGYILKWTMEIWVRFGHRQGHGSFTTQH